jgi:hypothetical protein
VEIYSEIVDGEKYDVLNGSSGDINTEWRKNSISGKM